MAFKLQIFIFHTVPIFHRTFAKYFHILFTTVRKHVPELIHTHKPAISYGRASHLCLIYASSTPFYFFSLPFSHFCIQPSYISSALTLLHWGDRSIENP